MTDADRVFVTAADYNPQAKHDMFDSAPFRAPGYPEWDWPRWVVDALKDGSFRIEGSNTDYAMWRIKTPDGDVIAGPGDVIVKEDRGFAVFPSRAAAP